MVRERLGWILAIACVGAALVGCGGEQAKKLGYLKIVNGSGKTIYNPNIRPFDPNSPLLPPGNPGYADIPVTSLKPSEQGTWERDITQDYTLTSGQYVVVQMPVGRKDYTHYLYEGSSSLIQMLFRDALHISEEEMAVASIDTRGVASFSYTTPPGSAPVPDACANASMTNHWMSGCSAGGMAACYCAAAYVKKACGDTTWTTEAGLAAQLGTSCGL